MSKTSDSCLTPDEYEEVVAELAEGLIKRVEGPATVGFGRTNLIRGASGFEHQIDVSVTAANHLFLAECKCWNSAVPVEKVLAFLGRVGDIQSATDLEVVPAVVTTQGFQSGCETIGAHYGVSLDVVRNSQEFVLRYLKHASAGVSDGIGLGG